MSKQTVVNEQDEKQVVNYERLSFVEFLEWIGRLADLHFKGSEMEEITLDEKLEYVLDDLLPMVGAEF